MERYFVNAFLEVDVTTNEETIRLLEKCGNCFANRVDAIKFQKSILKLLS